jgi:hypothetical protein
MIQQVRTLLTERNVTRAVIIDDAYDDRPKSGDIEDLRWDRFFDDLTDQDEQRLSATYGKAEYDRQDATELRRDSLFIDAVWTERAHIAGAGTLFDEFDRGQQAKRAQLQPLRDLLEQQLGLACDAFGRDENAVVGNADILFLDLFLGVLESEEAVNRAIARVKGVVDQRRAAPPNVILLSASPKLHEVGPRLRDEAQLLGCQFRMVRKSDLVDVEKMAERLYDLVVTYPDSQKVNAFLLAWDTALAGAKDRFLKSIRTLDLADYANLQSLVLEAEDEPVGDYVLDLYDLHLHHDLEGDETLVRAAKALNGINWSDYPPAQFMPSPELIDMMDGALFHNEIRTRIEAEITNDDRKVKLGDVFLGPAIAAPVAPAAAADGGQPAVVPEAARHAFVVLSQACDLQHANAEHVLLMRGTVRPYTAKQHDWSRQRTPVMRVGEAKFSIEWDVLAPETWKIEKLPEKVAEGFRRVRRFRTPFALQLQQDFVGKLGRVGTLTAVPARFPAGVRVFLKTRDGNARLLAERTADSNDAAYLVGRTAKGDDAELLLLSESFQDDLRRTLRAVAAPDLPLGGTTPIATLRDDPAFYRRFKPGVPLKRANATAGSKPFANTPHDVVQIIAASVCKPGEAAPASFRTIIVEVELD